MTARSPSIERTCEVGEILPDGSIQGYACANCGRECGLYGHFDGEQFTCEPKLLTLDQIEEQHGPITIERHLSDGTPLPAGWMKAGINRHGWPVYKKVDP